MGCLLQAFKSSQPQPNKNRGVPGFPISRTLLETKLAPEDEARVLSNSPHREFASGPGLIPSTQGRRRSPTGILTSFEHPLELCPGSQEPRV